MLIALAFIHGLSLVAPEAPPANAEEAQLRQLMRTYERNLMGTRVTTEGLMTGFSASFSLFSLALGAAALAVKNAAGAAPPTRRLAAIYAAALTALTAVSLVFFFPAPTAFLAAAALCFAVAAFRIFPS